MTLATDFDYLAAHSVDEAVRALGGGSDGAILAGGQSLLTDLKLGRSRPALVVDIGRIAGLDGIDSDSDGGLRVGAMVTLDTLARADQLASGPAALADAITVIGDPQVRNRATVGGGVANRTRGADLPAVALACGAVLEVVGTGGPRSLAAEDAFGPPPGAMAQGEIIVAVHFPGGGGSAYEKLADPGSGYAVCGVAAAVSLAADGTVEGCRVAVTGAGAQTVRLAAVETALTGTAASAENIASAATQVGAAGVEYQSDVAATAEYRAHLTGVLTARSLTRAVDRARRRSA